MLRALFFPTSQLISRAVLLKVRSHIPRAALVVPDWFGVTLPDYMRLTARLAAGRIWKGLIRSLSGYFSPDLLYQYCIVRRPRLGSKIPLAQSSRGRPCLAWILDISCIAPYSLVC
jgi:hypothetical protein